MARADDLIGAPGEVDWYTYPLVGQVDYVISALGASNGNTLQDPAVVVYDSAGNFIASGDDSWALGKDPLLQFKAPSSGTYTIGVFDATNSVGSYSLVVDAAGPPVFFGSLPGSI
jgi:hypothetical protein